MYGTQQNGACARYSGDRPGTLGKDPRVRKFSIDTRLTLGTALLGIVTGPDPVDALLDMVAHTTLVADAMRNEAEGKDPGSPEARSAVREVGGIPAQLSQERVAALQDMFVRIERERQATLEQMALIIQKERSATLAQAGEVATAQRRAIIEDLTETGARAEQRGREWGTALVVNLAVLITAVLVMLFGMLLLYRRLLQRMERHPPPH